MAERYKRVADAATIIARLGGNPDTGMAPCPAHDDSKPSLHVSDGRNGVLVYCHAGCSQEAVIAALEARGLWTPSGESKPGPGRSDEETYEAADKDARWNRAHSILRAAAQAKAGAPTAYLEGRGIKIVPPGAMLLPAKESARLTFKRFPGMVLPILNEAGEIQGAHLTWLSTDGKEKLAVRNRNPRRMYGAAKGGFVQLGEPDPDRPLIVGEGIETTLSAMQLADLPGIAALSTANFGSIRLPPSAGVIIACDHDPPGRAAAAELAKRLEYEGRQVRIVLPPVEGDDWNSRLREGEEQARNEWRAAREIGDPEAPAGPISALEETTFMNLAFAKRELFLDPWLPRPGLGMIHAPRGEAKTWFALAVGKAVAGGHDLLGWPCPGYGRVLYVDGELPGAALQERLGKFRPSPPEMFHVLSRDAFHLRRQFMPNLGEEGGRRELDRIIERARPGLIILDSLSTLVRGGVENEAESWAPIQDWLLRHRWQGRTMILVHHEGKAGGQRGTSKREDILDTMIGLKKQTSDEGAGDSVFKLSFTKSRDFYGEDAEPLLIRLSIRDGFVAWTHETVRNARDARVQELLDADVPRADIAKELNITKGRLAQIEKRLRDGNVHHFRKRE